MGTEFVDSRIRSDRNYFSAKSSLNNLSEIQKKYPPSLYFKVYDEFDEHAIRILVTYQNLVQNSKPLTVRDLWDEYRILLAIDSNKAADSLTDYVEQFNQGIPHFFFLFSL